MATIATRENVFTVGYEARSDSGEKRHFESQYTPDGGIVFERRLDPLSFAERWREDRCAEAQDASPTPRHGIYETITPSGLLAFLDKSASEEYVFLNWRLSAAPYYSRVAIGQPQFLEYGRKPRPLVSDIVHHENYLGIAWVREVDKTRELIFTRVSIEVAAAAEHVIAKNVPFTTSISAANIGPRVIVVRHTGILKEGADSDVVPYFFALETAI